MFSISSVKDLPYHPFYFSLAGFIIFIIFLKTMEDDKLYKKVPGTQNGRKLWKSSETWEDVEHSGAD